MINLQARGQYLKTFVLQGRYPGFAISVATAKADNYKTAADLKGMKIGVTSPGSSTNIMVNLMLAKIGMSPTDAAIIGAGAAAGVVAAKKNNEVEHRTSDIEGKSE